MTPEQHAHAVVFNAILPALQEQGEWLRLGARWAITHAVLAALSETGMVVVQVADLDLAVDALVSEADFICGKEDCWNDACGAVVRLRAALPERTDRG